MWVLGECVACVRIDGDDGGERRVFVRRFDVICVLGL